MFNHAFQSVTVMGYVVHIFFIYPFESIGTTKRLSLPSLEARNDMSMTTSVSLVILTRGSLSSFSIVPTMEPILNVGFVKFCRGVRDTMSYSHLPIP